MGQREQGFHVPRHLVASNLGHPLVRQAGVSQFARTHDATDHLRPFRETGKEGGAIGSPRFVPMLNKGEEGGQDFTPSRSHPTMQIGVLKLSIIGVFLGEEQGDDAHSIA